MKKDTKLRIAHALCLLAAGLCIYNGGLWLAPAIVYFMAAVYAAEELYLEGRVDALEQVIAEEKRRLGQALREEAEARHEVFEVLHGYAKTRAMVVPHPGGPSS